MTTGSTNVLGGYFAAYDVAEDVEPPQEPEPIRTSLALPSISAAPGVESIGILNALSAKDNAFKGSRQELMRTNLPANIMFAPLQGPLLPQQRWGGLEQAYNKSSVSGNVEKCHINDTAFDLQRNSFQRKGVAEDPSDFSRPNVKRVSHRGIPINATDTNSRILTALAPEKKASAGIDSLANKPYYVEKAEAFPAGDETERLTRRQKRHRRVSGGEPGSDTYLGPWAPPVAEEGRRALLEAEAVEQQKLYEERSASEKNLAGKEVESNSISSELDDVSETAPKGSASLAVSKTKVTSVFHGKSETNFQGLSWLSLPQGFKERNEDQLNYLPKRLVHTYVGHTMGVQAIRFFPESGHLLLSASMDSQCKIWDVYNQRKCLRTYMNHSMAVRDVQFADSGKKFYTCSFDKNICLWDTEYGKIIGTFTNDKTPYCVSVHPGKGMDNVFIIGSSNKKAVQFDAKSGEITQEYNEHLAAVNTVTFCEDGLRLATTGDDKKMFIWEFGIPVVVKHIAEPHMHSMPAARLHPSKKFLACQSMDNQIVVYEAAGRYRFQGPRRFRGHGNAGYAILPGFSPDGRFIMSGDVSGKVWFWDWKTAKNHRTLQAHDRVCMGTEWHPTMVSRIATCGWDGLVKLWE